MKVQNTRGKKKKAIIKILNTEKETFRKKYMQTIIKKSTTKNNHYGQKTDHPKKSKNLACWRN